MVFRLFSRIAVAVQLFGHTGSTVAVSIRGRGRRRKIISTTPSQETLPPFVKQLSKKKWDLSFVVAVFVVVSIAVYN